MKVELATLVDTAAKRMKLDIEELRRASDHAGLKGSGAEAIVASFLRERLPQSLGVTTGHVVDPSGQLSKQADVVVYDAQRTPMIFRRAYNDWDVVPAEGVIAVIEVKMSLTAAMLDGIVANAQTVLNLQRTAYFGDPVANFDLHGKQWTELPIFYSVFAFETDNMYSGQWNVLLQDHAPEHRITSVCSLDRGVSLSFELTMPKVTFVPHPSAYGLADIATENALLLWFTSLSAGLLQARLRPINLMAYAGDLHRGLTATSQPPSPEDGRKVALSQSEVFMQALGLPPGTATAMLEGDPLTAEQLTALAARGWVQEGEKWVGPHP